MPEPTVTAVEEPKVKELTAQEKLDAVASILKQASTGRVEPWDGKRGPMFNVYLKQDGQGPSGVKNFKTVADLAKAIIQVCKDTKYFIRFKFQIPNGSGGFKDQNATLVSVAPQGYLVFAGRESHQVSFTTSVDKVQSRKPIIENVEEDASGNVDLGLDTMKSSGQSEILIG